MDGGPTKENWPLIVTRKGHISEREHANLYQSMYKDLMSCLHYILHRGVGKIKPVTNIDCHEVVTEVTRDQAGC